MATPAATATEYCALLAKSKLLPGDEVDSLYKKWKEERPGGDERVDSFRRFLVNRKALTEYQAMLVQRGRAEGFFIGGYKILDQIGKGQMGGVYKAVHNFGQIVALKILPASRAKNSHVLGRFQREARLLTQFEHANVVRAYQVGETNGVHYIAMEYLEGETLNDVLERRTRLPVGEAVRLVRQALDGLQHLHDRRTVHRDLKPANLMLTPGPEKGKPDTTWDATLKILDIGLGRELFDDDAPEGQIETQLTQEGSVLGTPDYLAPEQAKDARSADIRADIYSIGCVLYHCLTGKPPFPETNVMAQMLRHATEAAAPLAAQVPGLPAGFQAVMNTFLAKTPDERYQTPDEAAAALKPFATGGAPAVASKLVPAYKDWLDSESAMEIPKVPPAQAPAPAPVVKPAAQGVKPGTAPAPALKPGSAPIPLPAKPGAPRPGAQPPKPAAPQPVPAPQPAIQEVDVELVTEPVPAPAPPRPSLAFDDVVPAPAAVAPPPPRKLWPPDRRDWIMLAAGATGVLAAVGLGFGLAKVLKRKPEGEE
jgi:serine/threonine protein kinase